MEGGVKMKNKIVKKLTILTILIIAIGVSACANNEANVKIEENTEELSAIETPDENLTDDTNRETFALPTTAEVENAREIALEGMTEGEINRLQENIKVANLAMESAYLNDNIFERLTDKEDLYWNYVDQKGDIQIGWAYDGTYKDIKAVCDEENLTLNEFYELYGTPVMAYNRFDAENFITLMEDMKTSIHNEDLIECFDLLIQNMEEAAEEHTVEPMVNIYKILHDMDYYLLRYGPTDVSPYVKDGSLIGTYYGTMPFYAEQEVITRYIDFASLEVLYAESDKEVTPLSITLVSEKDNGISQTKDWIMNNSLFLPVLCNRGTPYMEDNEAFPKVSLDLNAGTTIFYDELYLYEWTHKLLNIYDKNNEKLLYSIEYETSDTIFPANCAVLRDGILYIGSIFNGYATGNNSNCFLIAYDIEKDKVLWRSDNQTFNSSNFILKDGIIICGYGFTGEDDYIYQIDANTGKVIDKVTLEKMPDMFVEKDGQLYVHTYSYDYVFDMN